MIFFLGGLFLLDEFLAFGGVENVVNVLEFGDRLFLWFAALFLLGSLEFGFVLRLVYDLFHIVERLMILSSNSLGGVGYGHLVVKEDGLVGVWE